MSDRMKSKYIYHSPYGDIELTCYFKFERATEDQKFNPAFGGGRPICNGCGPAGYGAAIPDDINGVVITICGHIHNWTYRWGKDQEDKAMADQTFGDNMDRVIRAAYLFEQEQENKKYEAIMKGIGKCFAAGFRRWVENQRHNSRLIEIKKTYNERLFIAEHVFEAAVRVFGKSAFWDKGTSSFTLDDIS